MSTCISILFTFFLRAVHFIYILFIKARLFWKQLSLATSKPLRAPRRRIPKHLAVVFIIDPNFCADTVQTTLTESALKLVEWCQTTGIPKLTLYEEHDRLSKCAQILQDHLLKHGSEAESSESEAEYPLTPPPSDYSDSRSLSLNHYKPNIITIHVPQHTPSQQARNLKKLGKHQDVNACRHALTLCLASRQSAKPAIASAAHSLAQAQTQNRRLRKVYHSRTGGTFKLSVDQFDQLLENEDGLSSPDFMIVQPINPDSSMYATKAIELHGFPPWHIRLTEIYQSSKSPQLASNSPSTASHLPLNECSFKEALDEFASAEMRFGK